LRYVYLPVVPRDKAKQSALRQLLETFFDNSAEQALTALLNLKAGGLSRENLDRLSDLIEKAKQEEI
jgi:predicted transcriptional regulator